MSKGLPEAVRGLRAADPDLGVKPLLAKLREQQPDLEAGSKEVRKALTALKTESEAANETREQDNTADTEQEPVDAPTGRCPARGELSRFATPRTYHHARRSYALTSEEDWPTFGE